MTAPGSGAEIIPFLKTWVNLPMAIAFTVVYSEVCISSQNSNVLGPHNRFTRSKLSLKPFPSLPPTAVQHSVNRDAVLHLHHPIHPLLRRLRSIHVPSP